MTERSSSTISFCTCTHFMLKIYTLHTQKKYTHSINVSRIIFFVMFSNAKIEGSKNLERKTCVGKLASENLRRKPCVGKLASEKNFCYVFKRKKWRVEKFGAENLRRKTCVGKLASEKKLLLCFQTQKFGAENLRRKPCVYIDTCISLWLWLLAHPLSFCPGATSCLHSWSFPVCLFLSLPYVKTCTFSLSRSHVLSPRAVSHVFSLVFLSLVQLTVFCVPCFFCLLVFARCFWCAFRAP